MTKPKTKNYLISGILAGILCGMIAIFIPLAVSVLFFLGFIIYALIKRKKEDGWNLFIGGLILGYVLVFVITLIFSISVRTGVSHSVVQIK